MNALVNVKNRILEKIEDHVTVKKIWHNLAVEHLLSNTIESRSRFIQRLEFRSRFDLHTECKACRRGHHYSCSGQDRTNIDNCVVNISCTCKRCKEQAAASWGGARIPMTTSGSAFTEDEYKTTTYEDLSSEFQKLYPQAVTRFSDHQ